MQKINVVQCLLLCILDFNCSLVCLIISVPTFSSRSSVAEFIINFHSSFANIHSVLASKFPCNQQNLVRDWSCLKTPQICWPPFLEKIHVDFHAKHRYLCITLMIFTLFPADSSEVTCTKSTRLQMLSRPSRQMGALARDQILAWQLALKEERFCDRGMKSPCPWWLSSRVRSDRCIVADFKPIKSAHRCDINTDHN